MEPELVDLINGSSCLFEILFIMARKLIGIRVIRFVYQKRMFHTKVSILSSIESPEDCIPKRKGFIPKFQFFDFAKSIKQIGMKVIRIEYRKGKVSYQSH